MYDYKPHISIYFILSYSAICTTMLGSYHALERMALAIGSQPSLETRVEMTQLWEHAFLSLSYTLTTITPYAPTSTISTTTISSTNSTTVGHTPYELVYHKHILLPIEFQVKTYKVTTQLGMDLREAQ
jgi:hypothetical protein